MQEFWSIHEEPEWRVFPASETDDPPPRKFMVFPPNCVAVVNVVTQVHFNKPFDGDDIMKKYMFCRRNSKNRSAVIIQTQNPDGSAGVYGAKGMMMITGSSSARKSRYTADVYVDLIRRDCVPNLHMKDFRVINITTTFSFEGLLDVDTYKIEACPELRYTPGGFSAARKELKRTGALLSLFPQKATTLGARNIHDICLDIYDELDMMRPYMIPFGSEAEKELTTRISKRSRCEESEEVDVKRVRHEEWHNDDDGA